MSLRTKKHTYTWSASVNIIVINKNTDAEKTLAKSSYSKKMMSALNQALTESNDIASFVSTKYKKIVSSISFTFDEKHKCLKIKVDTNIPLTSKDISYVESYLEGQLSDGWGEGFEQIPFYETKMNTYQMFSLWKTLKTN